MTQQHKKQGNVALIDGQNLYMGTMGRDKKGWEVDLFRFRVWLKEKYGVEKAYYFIGYTVGKYQDIYTKIQEAGFILIIKNEYPETFRGNRYSKRDNVDSDVVFFGMKELLENKNMNKIVLVSGDGDFIKMVRYFRDNNKLEKVIFPNKKRSSLYKEIEDSFGCYITTFKKNLI